MHIRVLLVDDEERFAGVLAERLTARDLTVTTAFSGSDALSLLEKKEVDVVVLDVHMPGLGGLEVLKRIKDRLPGMQVILLSGEESTRGAIQGMHLGAFDYLMKPLPVDDLDKRIHAAAGLDT